MSGTDPHPLLTFEGAGGRGNSCLLFCYKKRKHYFIQVTSAHPHPELFLNARNFELLKCNQEITWHVLHFPTTRF